MESKTNVVRVNNLMMAYTLAELFKAEHGVLPDSIRVDSKARYEDLSQERGFIDVKIGELEGRVALSWHTLAPNEWLAGHTSHKITCGRTAAVGKALTLSHSNLREITRNIKDEFVDKRRRAVDAVVEYLVERQRENGKADPHTVYIPTDYDVGRGRYRHDGVIVMPMIGQPSNKWKVIGTVYNAPDCEVHQTFTDDDIPDNLKSLLESTSHVYIQLRETHGD